MRKYISVLTLLLPFGLAACNDLEEGFSLSAVDATYQEAKRSANSIQGTAGAFPDSEGAPIVSKANYQAIVQFNHILADKFLSAADRSRRIGKGANATLIVTSVLYGIGNTNGVNSDTLTNGLIVGLGLSEGIKYGGANDTSNAFLAAADRSSCIAKHASAKTGERSEKNAAVLWEAMVTVQTDLRRSLQRKPIGFIRLATGLIEPKSFESDEYELSRAKQRLSAHEKQKAMETKGGAEVKETLEYKLLDCLSSATSGDE